MKTLLTLFVLFFSSSVFSENVVDLIGKKIKVITAFGSCEYSFFWNGEVSSSCFEGSLKYEINKTSNNIQYITWGPVLNWNTDRLDNVFELFFFDDKNNFGYQYKTDKEGEKWSSFPANLEISEIDTIVTEDLIGKKVKVIFHDIGSCEYNFFKTGEVTSSCFEGSFKYEIKTSSDNLKYITWGPVLNQQLNFLFYDHYYMIETIFFDYSNDFIYAYLQNKEGAKYEVLSANAEISEIENNDTIVLDKEVIKEMRTGYLESCKKEAPIKVCECFFDNAVIAFPEADLLLNTDVTWGYRQEKGIVAPKISEADELRLVDEVMKSMTTCY